MTDLISDNSQPQLRKVTLAGDAKRDRDQKTQRDARFFWVLSAAAPYFGRLNVFDKLGKPSGVNADHVYPLRVLAADQPRAGNAGGPPWRRPRLVDLHLLVGATNPFYAERPGDSDRLIVSFSKTSQVEVPALKGTILQTFPEAEEPRPAAATAADVAIADRKAPFVRAVAEPLPIDGNQWPPFSDVSKDIPVPPLRLVAGRVGLRVALVNANGATTKELGWLKSLGVESNKEGKAVWAQIWLVPDGIEFDATFQKFPGCKDPLVGRVRLSSDDTGKFYLNLLSAAKATESAWSNAWNAITPAVRESGEDRLLGLKFAGSHGGRIPGFRWPVTMQNGVPAGLGPLEIPQQALRVELVSPSENGDVDGVATLATGWVKAETVVKGVKFTFGAAITSPSAIKIRCLPGSIGVTSKVMKPLGIHVDRLAADLRDAYGIEAPPAVPPIKDNEAAGPAFARPLLPAFVPLVDGWLQLPVPNLGPLDTNQDINLTALPPEKRKPSLFGEGFFRLKRLGPPAGVLSALPAKTAYKPGTQAPWAMTIARATELFGTVVILPGKDTDPAQPAAPPSGLLDEADIVVDGFNLSARGLVWISADRPDALEALPRLGAGPGSFVDLVFESDADDLLRASLSDLEINATRGAGLVYSDPMAVNKVAIALDFETTGNRWKKEILKSKEAREALKAAVEVVDGKSAAEALFGVAGSAASPWSPVFWRRHPVIPLAAAMPMTRAAAGAVRPLESRDLMPFVVETKPVGNDWRRLATLSLADGEPFVKLDDAIHYKTINSWPWDGGADASANPDRGIAFAALGLPGVELRPISVTSVPEGISYEASLRYDLPALDEAFATAPLPPQPGGPASKEEREMPPEKPVATALDWPLLAEFWADQERKHQNSRVADSYMMPFKPVDRSPVESKVDVTTLIKGLTWGGVSIQVGTKPVAGVLPYGSLLIGSGTALSGNEVLKGLAGKFKPNVGTETLDGPFEAGPLEVLGFSPATFKFPPDADDYFDLDNRLTGIRPPTANPVGVLSRPVKVPGANNSRLVSLLTPTSIALTAKVAGQDIKREFQFWFKDVLFEGDKAALDVDDAIAFDVWDNANKLARAGFEWRLIPSTSKIDAEATFRLGRNQIPFFGFWLEPLRLTALSLKNDKVATASILCRLTLGEVERSPDPGLNLVTLNLTLNNDGQTLRAAFAEMPPTESLRFSFAVADELNKDRRVAIEARVKASTTSIFDLAVSRFAVDVAGVDVEFKTAAVTFALPAARTETVSFTAGKTDQAVAPGAGRLRISSAVLTAGLELTTSPILLKPVRPDLKLNYVIEIKPRGDSATSPTGLFSFAMSNAKAGKGTITLFGQHAEFLTNPASEGDGAIVLAVPSSALMPGPWKASLGLVVRLKEAGNNEGLADFAFGHCEGDLGPQAPDQPVALGDGIEASDARLRFTLSNAGSGADWKGTATVSGTVKAKNSINWPSITWKSKPPTIPLPLPGDTTENNGRVAVTPQPMADVTTHNVTWILSGHRLDLALAAALAEKAGGAVWPTLVTARHELSRGGKKLRWTGVETVAVGYPAAMIPEIPKRDGKPDLAEDSTTFAARYKGRIQKSHYDLPVEPGMHTPGLGAVATVLQGALGAAFRTAFWEQPIPGLIVMGGFLGALRLGAETAAPLLRLPVLAGLGERKIGQTVPAEGIELSWTDGPAARLLALTRSGAPSPADASLDALRAAALAGSLPVPPSNADDSWDDPAGSLLVEQSYVNADLVKSAKLETTPFFLASAVTVERMFRLVKLPAPDQIESLSLVAGSSILRGQGKKKSESLSLASAIALRDRQSSRAPQQPMPCFALVGERLTVADWIGPAAGEGDATPVPMLNGLAVARDKNPRVAFVTTPPVQRGRLTRYFPHAFPPPMLDAPATSAMPAGFFADHGRGSVAMPGADQPLRWLAPVVEGAVRPIRDDDIFSADPEHKLLHTGSGLAGLTRRVRLPAHTGTAIELAPAATDANPQVNDDFVWLSQTQVPIYLPLRTTGLKGPPIGWLTPATPLTRLPVSGDVLQAIRASGGDDGAPQEGKGRQVQPFLPQELSAASVGERAGVMTARRARLLGGLGTIGTFDPMYARFGRPAQGGSSFARQLRTPRPARLPANTGKAEKDRRIQASSVQPRQAFAAVIGSADVVEGVKVDKYGAWSIRVVAAPEFESAASDLWDGTVRLACRIFVVADAKPDPKPSILLGQALIEGPAAKLETRGLLKIGNTAIAFTRARFKSASEWTEQLQVPKPPQDPGQPEDTRKLYRGDVDIILMPQPPTLRDSLGVAHPDIARAFAAPGPLPAVEVQWTVHPSSGRPTTAVTEGELPFTIVDPKKPELARGNDRAPITLRMPLYPVTAMRGALPLTPVTLLFADPAYDRDLAGPPAADGNRLELTEDARKVLPAGRGDLKLVLAADRNQLNRRGTVTFMLDVRFERPMDDVAQAVAEAAAVSPGGDLMVKQDKAVATMQLELQPRGEPPRRLRFAGDTVEIELGSVYELPLAAVTEADGSPARLSAGDILVMETALVGKEVKIDQAPVRREAKADLWHSAAGNIVTVDLLPKPPADPNTVKPPTRSLRFVLTDDPVIEPPSALYAALLRTAAREPGSWRLAAPLHAQSPLPSRVDLVEPARDFRRGMMRRHASFVWTLVRPRAEFKDRCVYVVKADRNGQTYLPESEGEFQVPEVT